MALLLSEAKRIVFSRGEWEKHLPLLPPDSDAHRSQYFNKSHRCFMLSLESRVITYHQSKLIIADWVGVVNDYRRGRAGTVSHTVLQSMVNLAKGEEGLRRGG